MTRGSFSWFSSVEAWLGGHSRAVLAALIVVGALSRGIYYVQFDHDPIAHQVRWDQSDMHFFDRWAKEIAAGDWLGNRPLHPLNQWHLDLAREHFARAPQDRWTFAIPGPAAPPHATGDDVLARALWDDWYRGKVFHQEPLYPYLIAATYLIFGPEVRAVYLWQVALGLVTIVLVVKITRRYFGEGAAALAGLMASLCGPSVYYETLLLRTAPETFMGMWAVDCLDRAREAGTGKSWLRCGVVLGLAVLLKSTFLLLCAGTVAALLWQYRRKARQRWATMSALVAGLVLTLTPLMLRNLVVGVPPLSVSAVAPVTFLCGNLEGTPPWAGFFCGRETGRIMGETGGQTWPVVLETLRTHPGTASYLELLAGKLGAIWHWYEIPNNANYYYFALHAPVLSWLLSFGMLAPLGLLGMFSSVRSAGRHWPLWLLVLATIATMMSFYVLSRFRAQLLVAMIPFAAAASTLVLRWAGAGAWRPLGAGLALLCALSWFVTRDMPNGTPPIRPIDYMVIYATTYTPLVETAAEGEDWEEVVRLIQASLEVQPPGIAELLEGGRKAGDSREATLARFYADVYRSLGAAYERLGWTREAAENREYGSRLMRAVGE